MTIHHDKMAYGRLASSREELSEDKIAQMLAELNAESEDEKKKDSEREKDKTDNKSV